MGMLLTARTGRAKIEQEFPHVRVSGFDIAAAQELQFRTWARVRESHPVFIRIVAVGNAVYKDEVTGRRIARDRIVIEAGVKNIEGQMSFSSYLK